jgi:hypothetical protein
LQIDRKREAPMSLGLKRDHGSFCAIELSTPLQRAAIIHHFGPIMLRCEIILNSMFQSRNNSIQITHAHERGFQKQLAEGAL